MFDFTDITEVRKSSKARHQLHTPGEILEMCSMIDDRLASLIVLRSEITKPAGFVVQPSLAAQLGVPQMVRRAQPQMQLGQGHGDFDELGWVRIDR